MPKHCPRIRVSVPFACPLLIRTEPSGPGPRAALRLRGELVRLIAAAPHETDDRPKLLTEGTSRRLLGIAEGAIAAGLRKSAFRLAPPLVLDQYDVDTGMGILEECLGEED